MIRELIIVTLLLTVIDLVFIKYVLINPFGKMIQNIQLSEFKPNTIYVYIPYLLMIFSILFFSLPNVTKDNLFKDSLIYGGLLGLVIFGVYEFTNMSVFKNYNLHVAIFDTLWGVTLFTIVTFLSKKTLLYLKDLI